MIGYLALLAVTAACSLAASQECLGLDLLLNWAMIAIDLVGGHSYGWARELIKLLFLSAGLGLFQGFWGWHNDFLEPVPSLPDYPPAK